MPSACTSKDAKLRTIVCATIDFDVCARVCACADMQTGGMVSRAAARCQVAEL